MQPMRASATLPWIIWSDGSYAVVVNHLNAELERTQRDFELYEIQLELIARYGPRRLFDTKVNWAHPAFAAGHVFVRNDKEVLSASLKVAD